MPSPARRPSEPNLSPPAQKARFPPIEAIPKGYRQLSGSGNRRETIQLSHPRLCDNRQARLIGSPVNGGPGADSPCQGEMLRSDRGGRVAVLWARSARRPRPPAILWFLSHRWERNSPRRAKPCKMGQRGHGPGQLLLPLRGNSPSAPALRGSSTDAYFLNGPLIRPLRGHLPPRGKV